MKYLINDVKLARFYNFFFWQCGSIAETIAYDLAMEVAMKEQNFQQRKLLLQDPWKWLLAEFASYYGVSDTYTKLRYPGIAFLLQPSSCHSKFKYIPFFPPFSTSLICDSNIVIEWLCRYVSYIMYVATPTNDCLSLVYDLLLSVIMKGHTKSTISHQEVWKFRCVLWYTQCL